MGDAATQVKREQGAVSCSSNGGGGRRQSRLHNFSFPSVSWGSHRLLRCLKIDPPGAPRLPVSDRRPRRNPPGLRGLDRPHRLPWNLRLRRAACNAPAAAMVNVGLHKANKQNQNKHQSPVAQDNAGTATNSGRGLRSEAPAEGKERTRFSQVLSKDEIEDDFLAMTGSKPPRRPKKRPRNIQKQIEMIYPGLYLCEITPELYRTSQVR
ncbi:unnamed protein product [Spirodela intermedia]|uniref:Uncharacterized protein n=1 Tax=Spirodela intermedia TaxID=51605 RepID=A0A7I8J6F7_SPIIN|nr:unnamed protein product [Spirodela intermedia]CAA6665325.1 unnamed protein product [Spirodela intermedia]